MPKKNEEGSSSFASRSFRRAADLSRWSSGVRAANAAVEAFQTEGQRQQRTKANMDFLDRLRTAEERDAAKGTRAAATSKATPSGLAPLAPGAAVPDQRVRPGEDTFREVDKARSEAKLVQREAAAKTRPKTRKLTTAELDLASELFWKSDKDASATIDRDDNLTLQKIITRMFQPWLLSV